MHNVVLIAGPLYPCNPATARSESTKLGVDPKGEKLIYTNGRAVIVSGRAALENELCCAVLTRRFVI